MIAFWILAPVMVVCALGLLFARKAVHCALLLAVVMISLAVLYAVQDAPFLFAVQIIVYTGAILMLFLFVLMLVGVDASDSVVETIRGQRLFAILVGLVFGATLVLGLAQVSVGVVVGLDEANAEGNVPAIAQVLFTRYVFAFEVTSALLITAALGAMVLAHRERLTPKLGQSDLAARRMRDYAEHGKHLGPLPPPGCLRPAQRRRHSRPAARRNAVGAVDLPGARRARLGQAVSGQRQRGRAGRRQRRDRAAARRLRDGRTMNTPRNGSLRRDPDAGDV